MPKQVDHVNQTDTAPDGEAVLDALHAVVHRLRAQHHRASPDDGLTLPPVEGRVLGFFARRPGATLSELAAHSGRDKGQLARLVAALRERGLLEGEPDAQDRRVQHLRPTEAGRLLQQRLRQQSRRLAARAVRGLEAAERAQLLALLSRLEANLDDED